MRHYTQSTILLFVVCWATCVVLDPCYAQITFERIYGGDSLDLGYCVQQTKDGGYVVAGRTHSFGMSGCDMYIVKTDSLGDTLWTRVYGGDYCEFAYCIQQTSDLGHIMVGDLVYSKPMDIYILKTDSLGSSLWDTTYFADLEEEEHGRWIQETTDSCYIVVGSRDAAVFSDVYLMKTTPFGDTLWTRTYGGTDEDKGNCVEQTSDGGYIIVGTTYSFGAGSGDIYLLRTDAQGDTIWTRTYGGTDADLGWSVQQTSDAGYVIAGATYSFGGIGSNVYIVKTDSVGDTLWTRVYGGDADDWSWSVDQTTDGGYIVAGETYSFGGQDVYLLRMDSAGDTVWTRVYGGSLDDWGNSVRQTLDGGYVIAGWSESFGTGYGDDVYLIKTDENGLTGVAEPSSPPIPRASGLTLIQNTPNPFHHSTLIVYSLPLATYITLSIYDVTGRLVETIVNETRQPGIHQVRWDRLGNPSGVYFYRLSAGESVRTRKMVVVE